MKLASFLLVVAAVPLAAAVDYQRDIRPLLAKRCIACHGPDEHSRQGNLRLDTREGAVGKTGGAAGITAFDSAHSRIVARVTDPAKPMPPGGPRLTDSEVALLRKWIDEGAIYASHWSFQKPVRAALPEVKQKQWVRNEIDAFILARLEKEGLQPAAEADAYTLARRVALDLTGLPPDEALTAKFLKDKSYEALVDRLLESPAYGERWARVWLDLARYADTQGYEKDNRRIIWPYRDWVIRAFNSNMPFDQFTVKQLAGDLLPNPTEDDLVATGFHRNTMTNTEGGTDDEEFRDAAVKDRVAVTGQVWMGLTTGCAQCHSHKYDPISHKEFYQLYGFFNQTEDADRADDAPVLKLASQGASTLILRDLAEARRRRTRIHERGNFLNPGADVEAGVPAAFHSYPAGAPRNRLGLAQWLVDKENPLTARVMANRLWARLYGTGIVETEEDFGAQGSSPSHPELLDWLATEFMRTDWNMKALLKTMVMSATYRQASVASPALLEKDPRNRLLARGARFRLDAEVVRDQALAASGLLSRKMYGPSVMPWQPEGIWTVVYNAERWVTSDGEDRYRRGLYTFLRRTSPYPSMITYDAPSGEVCTVRRIRTNTPLQALASLNDPVSMEAAQKLALRAMAAKSDEARVSEMYRAVLVRPPSKEEVKRVVALHKESAAELRRSAAGQEKLLHYDQVIYPKDRETDLVADARTGGPEWSYRLEEPPQGWQNAEYSDASWQKGKGQFGYRPETGNTSDYRIGTPWETEQLWLRLTFDVPAGKLESPKLVIWTSAGFEAFINGIPAASTNLDRNGYYDFALSKEAILALKPGRNVLAVHVTRLRERKFGQMFDASLRAVRPMSEAEASAEKARRAAWVVVANTLLNLDETLTRR